MVATFLPNAKQYFTDPNGLPLAGGSVYFYVPATTTPKNTWQDAAQTILNTNPVVLDASGTAIIFGTGDYRQIVKDAAGNTIWDQVVSSPLSPGDVLNSAVQAYLDSLPSVLPLLPNAYWWNGGVLSKS